MKFYLLGFVRKKSEKPEKKFATIVNFSVLRFHNVLYISFLQHRGRLREKIADTLLSDLDPDFDSDPRRVPPI